MPWIVFIHQTKENCTALRDKEAMKQFSMDGNCIRVFSTTARGSMAQEDSFINVLPIQAGSKAFFQAANEAIAGGSERDLNVLMLSEDAAFDPMVFQEMEETLLSFEKHGIVSPRMQCGTFLSLPYDLPAGQTVPENKLQQLIHTAREQLPSYSVIPSAHSACFGVRRELAMNFGFWDEAFEAVNGATIDLCCRINRFGYSVIAANHAFLHGGNAETASQADQAEINRRYPYYRGIVEHHAQTGVSAAEHFLDILTPGYYEKPRILFDFYNMLPLHNGTSEVQVNLVRQIRNSYADRYDVYIYTNREADLFHGLSRLHDKVVYPDTIEGRFHIGYAATQPLHLHQQAFLNRRCLKVVFTVLDIIMCRCNYLQAERIDQEDIMRLGLWMSDGVMSISDFSTNDVQAFFPEERLIQQCNFKTIYLSTSFGQHADTSKVTAPQQIPFADYYLIMGNSYAHKAVQEAIHVLSGTANNFIVIGIGDDERLYPNVHGYTSGGLSEEFLTRLYAESSAVVFPSQYEGFGLPVAIALRLGKRVIVHQSQVNRELEALFSPAPETVLFFSRFEQLPDCLEMLDSLPALTPSELTYSWENVAQGIMRFLDALAKAPVDTQKLNERWRLLNLVGSISGDHMSTRAIMRSVKARIKARLLAIHPASVRLARRVKKRLQSGARRQGLPAGHVQAFPVALAKNSPNVLEGRFTLEAKLSPRAGGQPVISLQGTWQMEAQSIEKMKPFIMLTSAEAQLVFPAQKLYATNAEGGMTYQGFLCHASVEGLSKGEHTVRILMVDHEGNQYILTEKASMRRAGNRFLVHKK